MRPVRLEVQGFTAFREGARLDFGDATVFALTGPTGSGKSSLIDAMVFALYGSVPRYGDRRAVEPVISLGREEARVRFDFTVGDASHTAVRVVRRTKQGATTAEARLEGPGAPVSGAREVTEAVERLLGLGFDHFTKSVVLPQGAFAEFLHDTGSDRRALLRRLLDVEVYGRVRSMADGRAKDAEIRAEYLESALADLADLDEGSLGGVRDRIERLEGVRERLAAMEPEIEEVRSRRARAAENLDERSRLVGSLEGVVVPDEVTRLSSYLDAASEARAQAATALETIERSVPDLERQVGEHPSAADLRTMLDRHAAAAELADRGSRGEDTVREAEAAIGEAESALSGVAAELEAARDRLYAFERAHSAHVLAAGLERGAPCPVCLRPIDDPPSREPLPHFEDAREEIARLERRHSEAVSDRERALAHLERCRATLESVEEQLTKVSAEIGDDDPEGTRARLEAVTDLERRLAEARRERAAAAAGLREAERRQEEARSAAAAAWSAFQAARDGVASAGPPAPDRDDLAGSWRMLAGWAATRMSEEREEIVGLSGTIGEADRRLVALEEEANGLLAGVDLEGGGGRSPREIVAAAVATEEARLARMEEDLARAAGMRREVGTRRDDARVARALALHLRSDRFEAWLLEEAFTALVVGANRRLAELTKGAYSLTVDDQDFWIVDHANADQRRGVRTLSGGETFLVSLSLALALSEQLSELAADGAARLESVFLDEGFGTLDADALDLVADVIDELGAGGRTVGIVTHVTELAERMPVRFEVRKVGPSASVEKVDA